MKFSVLKPFLRSLVTITILSQFGIVSATFAQGRGLSYITKPSESPEAVSKELEKKKLILKKLDQAEASENQKFFAYDIPLGSSDRVEKSQSFDIVTCAPASQAGKYATNSCREAILLDMCRTEQSGNSEKADLSFCKQYIDLATSNQNSYSEKEKNLSLARMCDISGYTVKPYKFLDRASLKNLLEACKQSILSQSAENRSNNASLLRNVNELFHVLEDYSGAKTFYVDLVKRDRKIFEEFKGELADTKKSDIARNWIFPTLTFLGDIHFVTGDLDQAIAFYLEANKIYLDQQKQDLAGRILSDSYPGGGYVSLDSVVRASSFIGSRSRLAYALAGKGSDLDAEKYLVEGISDLEKTTLNQRDKSDGIALQEIGSPLYSTRQALLIKTKEYEKALEMADRSRTFVYAQSLGNNSKDPNTIPPILLFSEMQALAKEQKATFVLYSIPDLPIYDYKNFRQQEDRVLIWVIQPDGKLNFRDVDIPSTLNQSISSLDSNSTKGLESLVNFGLIAFSIAGIGIAIFFAWRSRKNLAIIAGLVGVSFGIAFTLTQAGNNSPFNIVLRGKQPSSQSTTLTSLTQTTISIVKSRGKESSFLSKDSCQLESDCLQNLYKVLIQPIADLLPTNPEDHVVFVPHRGLHRVPFAALKSPDGKYLIEKHTVRVTPSLQALKIFTERAANTVRKSDRYLIVGNPIMPKVSFGRFSEPESISQLPSTEVEANEIANTYGTKALIGKDATVNAVQSALFNSKIIHLATHGFLNVWGATGSSLVLSPGNEEQSKNGLLDTNILYSSRSVAEMAVLSACDTGLGLETVEGNLGLTRPFLVAGVPTVISSLWSVPDTSTSELMIDFYKNLKTTPDKAKALRQAMLTTMKKYPEPVSWAGFTLTGLAELPKVSETAKQVVGKMVCGNIGMTSDLGATSKDIISAKLESSPTGFTLSLTEGNDAQHRLELDERLVVQSASSFDDSEKKWGMWNLVAYDKTPFSIKHDGSFKIHMAVSSRSGCSFEGKLEFIGDASSKLQKLQSTSSQCQTATLVASDPNTQINVRVGAGAEFTALNYGSPGDSVKILGSQKDSQGLSWYEVDFPRINLRGWIRSDFVSTKC